MFEHLEISSQKNDTRFAAIVYSPGLWQTATQVQVAKKRAEKTSESHRQ